ncbi:ATP-binding cassette domain-containing protein, partial [Parazoarcus communis]
MTAPLFELRSVSKTYPGVAALQGVSLSIAPGEVLGLIGENGAGKSTLMKILGGIVAPTSGEVVVDGAVHTSWSVKEATRAGIAFVHQELNLFENLDVAANVLIGREPRRYGWLNLIDVDEARRRVTAILQRLGVDFAADTPVEDLSIAQ